MFVLVAVKLLLVFMTTIFALLTILKLVKELLEFTTKGVDMYVQIVVKSLLKKNSFIERFYRHSNDVVNSVFDALTNIYSFSVISECY